MSQLQKSQEKYQDTLGVSIESRGTKIMIYGVGRPVVLSIIFSVTNLVACYLYLASGNREAHLDNGAFAGAGLLSTLRSA